MFGHRERTDAALAASVARRIEEEEMRRSEEMEERDLQLAREIQKQEKARLKVRREMKQASVGETVRPLFVQSY